MVEKVCQRAKIPAENKSLLRRGGFGGLEDPGDQRLPEGNTCGILKKGKVWLQDL